MQLLPLKKNYLRICIVLCHLESACTCTCTCIMYMYIHVHKNTCIQLQSCFYHDGSDVTLLATSLPLAHAKLLEHVHERILTDCKVGIIMNKEEFSSIIELCIRVCA